MLTQEKVFEFFRQMSHNLNSDGYPILDDLRHEFPDIPWYQDILDDIEEQNIIDDMVKTEEY